MGVNGYQLFVRSDDAAQVETAIRAYVDEHGADANVDPDGDDSSPRLSGRKQRTFVISPPVDGTIAVWEDGSWSDRRLARDLSKRLGTETIWLMISDITDTWAYTRYQEGEEAGSEHREPDDVHGEAERFARVERLPFALKYLQDPNEDADYAAFEKELAATGFFDEQVSDEEPESEWDETETEVGVIDLEDDDEDADARDDMDEDEGEAPPPFGPSLDSVRGGLREFSVNT